ncbi:hypothetical protein Poli38472_011074 [Pythium oligandrum]|uniref:Endonuclease/exonuclease/phosphatase domain-containing protein n=1 Tax=Pythium oligandrum TaxID=41045 RepID=A0A8K1FNL6_PYTOL|nr:hypothetical protein Poli38472_011074 [Pythium oligandrum]|eukprot:TMW67454.1 hypothetical protein Poli38472_011074 [Pythium oligandrum]
MEHKAARGGRDARGNTKRRRTQGFVRKWTLYPPRRVAADSDVPTVAKTFRVLSFNVLADYIALRDTIPDAEEPWKYDWAHRCRGLLREIRTWRADIICLQEVDHYEDFFEPELKKAGYKGVFKKRTGEDTHDGCAIFIHSKNFDIVASVPLEYHVPGHPLLDRHNIALQAVVDWRGDGAEPQRFVVANTHLLFNPGRGDVKLAQLQRLLTSLHELREGEHVLTPSSPLPVLVCGDFNLAPHSPLYEFLSRGELDVSGLSKHLLSGQNMEYHQKRGHHAVEHDSARHHGHGTAWGRFQSDRAQRTYHRHFPKDTVVNHSLPLASAYAQMPNDRCTGEPKFTTFHEGTKCTVDYVWFTTDSLHCHGVVEMAPAGQLFKAKVLPTASHSSDHLSLVADFALL